MSNWKDTVMSDEDLQSIEELELYHFKSKKLEKAIAQAQAEISFKAGIKEVVEWIVDNGLWINCPEEIWEVQLKIWFKDNPELLKLWGIE